MHSPVCSKHPLDALPGRQLHFLHLDDEIEHCASLPIRSILFAQGGSHQIPDIQAFFETIRQRNDGVCFAPVPDSRRVWTAEPKPCYPCLQVKSQTICL